MEDLKTLKKYPVEEAIYYYAFNISEKELENKSPRDIIPDYEHLKETVEELLEETIPERERTILREFLGDKKTAQKIGELHGIQDRQVRNIVHKALGKFCQPARIHRLDGTIRRMGGVRVEAGTRREHEVAVDNTWEKVAKEIERQKSEQAARLNMILPLEIEGLSLTPVCRQKLTDLGIKTVGELLEKFPYNPQTNGLTGLTVADGIDETDYREIWGALFLAGAFVHAPELPDYDALNEAERATMAHDEAETAEYKIQIDNLRLSIRSYNALRRVGISTVGELLDRLGLDAIRFLALDIDDAVSEIYNLNICHIGNNVKEVALYVREELRKIYPELALDDSAERTLEELDTRVKAISNGNSCIHKAPSWENMGPNCYTYYRSTHKSLPFRKTNMFDPERRNKNRSGKNIVYFALPEELDDLIEFVEHDEKLYHEANSGE